jgi:regulator of replication initiation timing
MWKSISQLLAFLFTVSDKYAHQDERIARLERQFNELAKQVQQLALAAERQAERDLWREQVFRQALENERLRLENQQLRELAALPPAKPDDKPDQA